MRAVETKIPFSAGKRSGKLLFELLFLVTAIFFFYALGDRWISAASSWAPLAANMAGGASQDSHRIGNINVLVLGVDSVDGTHRADTILVFGINPGKGRVAIMSVPRDTRVIINGRARKINEILPRYGEPVLRTLIEDLMEIQINRYVQVDFKGFVNVIDAIGGVEIDIAKPMHYDDNYGKLHIHFDKGRQTLDGQQALNYVRFRADARADLGRIKRQQKFISAVIKNVLTPAVFVKLPQIINEAFSHMTTDFSIQEIFAVARGFSDFQVKLRSSSLPGEARYIDKISYYLPYRDKAIELGSSYFSDLAALELVASFSPSIATGTINED